VENFEDEKLFMDAEAAEALLVFNLLARDLLRKALAHHLMWAAMLYVCDLLKSLSVGRLFAAHPVSGS